MMAFALFLFIFTIALSIESAKSLALPASIKHSPLGAFSSTHVTFPEVAFYSVSTTGKPSRDVCPSQFPSYSNFASYPLLHRRGIHPEDRRRREGPLYHGKLPPYVL